MSQSSTLTGRPSKARPRGYFVVDADVHAHESPAALRAYMEMPWRLALEQLEQVPARYLDIAGFAPKLGSFPPALTTGGGECTAADCSRSSRGNPRA